MGLLFDKAKRSKKNKHQYVDYWLDDTSVDLADKGATTDEVVKLASIKRAISNFVRIVTNRNIPVVFSSGNESYTSGEVVVISASTKEKNFDSVVGLALHEGSHCLLSDFEFLEKMKNNFYRMIPSSLKKLGGDKGLDLEQLRKLMFTLMNIFEDRRIDYWMYRTAYGYRPYYEAMYDQYFRDKQIDYALQQKVYANAPTVESYFFYLTNMTNPWFDTRDLPDLDLIYGMVDLPNINRLDNDKEGYRYGKSNPTNYDFDKLPQLFQLAANVLEIILKNVGQIPNLDPIKMPPMNFGTPQDQDENKEKNLDQGGMSVSVETEENDEGEGGGTQDSDDDEDENSQSGGQDSDGDTDENEDGDEDSGNGEGEDDDSDSSNSDGNENRKEKHADDLPPRPGSVKEKRLQKAIDKQKDFVDGNVKKKKITNKVSEQVKAIEQSGAKQVEVEWHDNSYSGTSKTNVLVLRKLTRSIMESGAYPFVNGYVGGYNYTYYDRRRYGRISTASPTSITLNENPAARKAVDDGFRKGKQLANRLAIRNQTQITRYNRQDKGRIDKRRLSGLGHGIDNVFYRTRKTEFDPVLVHLTIDASGSMYGDKLRQALEVAVTVAVAANEIGNLNIVISLRAGVGNFACISIVYDSREDDPSKIRTLFPYLTTSGSTPEGLCFEAIMDLLVEAKEKEKYFINLSDGMPAYEGGYHGTWAHKHTRNQVNRLRAEGFSILSYYIGGGYEGRANSAFREMYGKDASFIDTDSIPSLTQTLNKLFLTR